MSEIEYQHYVERIQEYIKKSIKEAKLQTSWINPNTEYENDVHTFIQNILNPENQFLSDFKSFVKKISSAGVLNSLSQVLIKLTSPGMPDIYQGNELWDFSLVDPDNRKPVDFLTRTHLMSMLEEEPNPTLTTKLMQNFEDGRIKLYTTMRTLQARRSNVEIFTSGDYLPLMAKGLRENNIIAYARKQKNKLFIVIAGRFFSTLMADESPIIPSQIWEGTALQIPIEYEENTFTDLFTGRKLCPRKNGDSVYLDMEEVFSHLTIAFLEGTEQ
jgi:(1->4)-alpha-D-glucan 1-alpha-D-glucosylmutase